MGYAIAKEESISLMDLLMHRTKSASKDNTSKITGKFTYGGWTMSLMNHLAEKEDVEIALAYPSRTGLKPDDERITFYPICFRTIKEIVLRKIFEKLQMRIKSARIYDNQFVNGLLRAIEDYHPDIIHVWGCEFPMGLVANYTDIPIVLHIQGILNPYCDAFFPPGMNFSSFLRHGSLRKLYSTYRGYRVRKDNDMNRETEICKHIKYFIGRTAWDRNVMRVLAPNAKYFHGDEMLRPAILESEKWQYHEGRKKLVISTTIRNSPYKGVDVVLRSAEKLKRIYGDDFEWNLYGVSDIRFFERFTGIKASEVNVICRGIVDAETLRQSLLDSDVYCHQSYIENSPNSVCEAQYLGVPIVAADGGGTKDMLKDDSGILVPTNDSYQTATYIRDIKQNRKLAEQLSKNAITVGEYRHNPERIVSELLETYRKILNKD